MLFLSSTAAERGGTVRACAHASPHSAPAVQGRAGGGGEAHGDAAAPAQPPAPLAAIATVAAAASPRARLAEAHAPPAASPRVAGPSVLARDIGSSHATRAPHMRRAPAPCSVRGCLLRAASAPQESSKWALGEIFKKIGDKATTEQARGPRRPPATPAPAGMRTRRRARAAAQGLLDLFLFMRERPDVDLSPHLAKTSPQFRNYIEKGLAQARSAAWPAACLGPADPACEPRGASHGAQLRVRAPDGAACAQVEQRLLAEERQAQLAA